MGNNNRAAIVVIFILLGVVFILFAWLVLSQGGQGNNDSVDEFKAYKIKAARSDSIVNSLRLEIDCLKVQRIEILNNLKKISTTNKKQEQVLNSQNSKIEQLEKDFKDIVPNYADSTIQAIDDVLPK